MGTAKLHTGQDVMIMSPDQWNSYCYQFNSLNSIPQPQQLIDSMQQ